MKKLDTRTHSNYNLHERKDGLSDYDLCKESCNGILKNVRKREDAELGRQLPSREFQGTNAKFF